MKGFVYIKSEIGFAFSHLLGFRLLPRLKPIHSQRLALVEAGTQDDYPHLKTVLGKAINWDVIRQQYDMMVKFSRVGLFRQTLLPLRT